MIQPEYFILKRHEATCKAYLARIFHTDCDEETAKADGVPPAAQETAGETAQSLQALLGRPSKGETSFAKRVNADEHFDAGLYVSILTRSHLLGSPLPSCP